MIPCRSDVSKSCFCKWNRKKKTVINTWEERKEQVSALIYYMEDKYWSKKRVWFMIDGEGLEYRIVIFYDNEYNHADGEDL